MPNSSVQDYLRTIYTIGEKNKGLVRSVDVAGYLRISKPSVSEMLRKLADKGYLKIEPYSNIIFRKKGFLEAEKQVYRFRICQLFVSDFLGVEDKDSINKEADLLEHALSDRSINIIDKKLGKPKSSLDGQPIIRIK